jgi:tetratricopeptide (TPR) repeat protein
MTTTLAHPTDEELGSFADGTLPDSERAALVEHIAGCDDCRRIVADAAEFTDSARIAPAAGNKNRWWLSAAAAILLAATGLFIFKGQRDVDHLAGMRKPYAHLISRPIEGRLSGFPYVPRITNRGADEPDDNLTILQGAAAEVTELRGNDSGTLHARGVALLLGDKQTAGDALAPLQAAVAREPENADYQSDLAAALIAAGQNDPTKLQRAVEVCDHALRINPRSQDALFNRAVALQLMNPPEAAAAYKRYLAVDSSSKWAAEARSNLEFLPPS